MMKLIRHALPIACAAASALSCGDGGQRTPLLVDATSAEPGAPGALGAGRAAPDALGAGRAAPDALGAGRAAPDALGVGRAAPPREGASGEHRFCGWLHEFLGDPRSTELGYDTFAAHAGAFDAVHPKWWRVASPTTFENHPRGRATPFAGFHDRRVLDATTGGTAGGGRTRLVPLVAAVDRPDVVAVHAMIHDPALRAQHVAGLAALVMENGYDGIDVDYEHLASVLGPGETVEAERSAFSAFIDELARALHAHGRTLSLAVPAVASARGVFDYEALSASADHVHVMSYDYHWGGGPHAGPVAPLGWLRRTVAYIGGIDGGARREKFILGLPNYGLLGPEAPEGGGAVVGCEPLSKCRELAGDSYATSTDHMSRCAEDGGERFEAGRAPNRVLASGAHLFFEDLESLEEKVVAASQGGLGGVTYWSIGGEPGGAAFFSMIERHFR
ncbi:glycosyl hydrolase family 18 protein [Sorangium sp. So ce321]|uniref:glycosyl hydrolase family 18 protein n=1 Tax=Sorangium sp. So ce321 TaxID=3133300 RepID=UPI003F5DF170